MQGRLWVLTGAVIVGLGACAALAAIMLRSPVAEFDPVAWRPAPHEALPTDDRLGRAEQVGQAGLRGPEDVAIDAEGRIYTGVEDGWIMRAALGAPAPRFERFAHVGGRPLGLALGGDGRLYVANHGVGLQAVGMNGAVETLLTQVSGEPILLANDLTIDSGGVIYLSDSSRRFNRSTIGVRSTYTVPDFLEGRPYGRVIRYDPVTGAGEVLADNLYFPNGVALTAGEQALLVVESTRNRLTRIWLKGPQVGEVEVVRDNLPGIGDGMIALAGDRLLVAAYYRVDALDHVVLPSIFMRHVLARMPDSFWASRNSHGFLLVLDAATGATLDSLHDAGRAMPSSANVIISDGYLYFGALRGDRIMRFSLDDAGLGQ